MDINRSEESRRAGLAFSLDLIARYERNQQRTREWNPLHLRTLEEIRRECDYYRREARIVWGFPDSAAEHSTETPR